MGEVPGGESIMRITLEDLIERLNEPRMISPPILNPGEYVYDDRSKKFLGICHECKYTFNETNEPLNERAVPSWDVFKQYRCAECVKKSRR